MPVAICSTNSARVALPNTYHQLAEERGTRWASTGPSVASRPARSSIHRFTRRTMAMGGSDGARQGGELTAPHPELTVAHLVLVLEQAARRRPRRMGAVLVVHAAVARAHEQARLREPAHRAAEVRAVDREDLELLGLHAAHPARDLGRRPVPRDSKRIVVDGEPRLSL